MRAVAALGRFAGMAHMKERFSSVLRAEADDIWRRIFDNPFLEEVKRGTLPLDTFRYYLTQDYLYLEGFGRAVAMALARAPDSQRLKQLSRRIVTPVERPLHQHLFALVGLSAEEAERTGPSPTNLAYINHMIRAATLGGLGQTAAALLPCPWSYHEIGERLGPVEHPVFSEWSRAYAEGLLEESTVAWRELLDDEADKASARDMDLMREAFMTSSRYEYLFWRMACQKEAWPL